MDHDSTKIHLWHIGTVKFVDRLSAYKILQNTSTNRKGVIRLHKCPFSPTQLLFACDKIDSNRHDY